MAEEGSLDWPEYVVFAVTLMCSVAIGIYYGCIGSKQKTTKEYLLADRNMSAWPVSMSLVCSAVSAITILGNPVEVYLYGTQYMLVILCFIPFSFSLAYLYLPVYFNLQLNSAYEYIELRFNVKVRWTISILAVLHLIVSMAIAVYAPALAINQVTGISTRVSTAIIYLVCIFYSALGGLKAVLWTDVFQALVMLASLLVTMIKGIWDVDNFSTVWQRAYDGQRIDFFSFDFDPRARHTIWTCVIAGYFFWLPTYAATQIQIQRFLSMPNIATARKALVLNAIGLSVVVLLCCFTGLVIFAKYAHCDPVANGLVSKTDQLLPLFVWESVGNIPGLMGLFVAGITCASMSTLSSGLSALTSITTYDYISKIFPNLSDTKLSFLSKVNCLLLGLISYSFVFIVENMGNVLPATSSILGIFAGPILGIFSLGMFFPSANGKGSVLGMIGAFVLMLLVIVGNQIASNLSLLPDQRLPLTTDGCHPSNFTTSTSPPEVSAFSDWKDSDDDLHIRILSMSYMWYSGLGCSLCVLCGFIASSVVNYTNKGKMTRVRNDLISPPVLWLWRKLAPGFCDIYMEEKP